LDILSTESIDSPKALRSTANTLPQADDPDGPTPRPVRTALLKSSISELETKILELRSSHVPYSREPNSESNTKFFLHQFTEYRSKIRDIRESYAAQCDQLRTQSTVLKEAIDHRTSQVVSMEKRLLLVSLEFARAKKEASQREKKGLLSKLFG
jgi:hypothetical protein